MKDFIRMKNDQAFDHIIGSIKKRQKNPRQPTLAQITADMKKYCCHVGGWKMSQFKRKTHEEVAVIYYRE